MKLWYPSIEEFVSSENASLELAKMESLFKSKIVSDQFAEYSSTSNFIRSTYPLFAAHIPPFKCRLLGICPGTEMYKS